MPNWTRTSYVFYAQEQDAVKDFHDKLLQWKQAPTLCPEAWDGSPSWLGNILTHAGFVLEQVDEELRYRGSLEEFTELEKGKLKAVDAVEYYYFTAVTLTAWVEMPKMWQYILDKLYKNLPKNERIGFAFLSEEETYEYVHAYNPDFLPLLGIAADERYSCLNYIGEDFSCELDFAANQYELSTAAVAELLTTILGRDVNMREVENEELLEQLVEEGNRKLKAVNRHYYVVIVPITYVSEYEFE